MATAGHRRGPGPERAFCETLPVSGAVRLDPDESSHLVRARRVAAGDEVVLFDGRGGLRLGRLVEADPRAAGVEVAGPYAAREPLRHVRMAVSLPEPARADRMVAALAELGVAALRPLTCARTDPGRVRLAARRAARWARAAREALKVNGCAFALSVGAPFPFEDALAAGALLLDPDPGAPALANVLGAADPTPWVLVGPEGGFTFSELGAAEDAGAPVARLGAAALRSGTAAVAAAAVMLA